jgi:hypothetical protein
VALQGGSRDSQFPGSWLEAAHVRPIGYILTRTGGILEFHEVKRFERDERTLVGSTLLRTCKWRWTGQILLNGRVGVDQRGTEWPSGMFEIAISDNGALISYLKDHFQEGLELQFEQTGSGRGDLKPVVESGFRCLNLDLIYRLEGSLLRTRDTREMKKIIKRARQNAMYTLQEFTALVAEYCIHRNHLCLIEGYPISDDMAGLVAPIPIRLWEYGIRHRSGTVRQVSVDEARLACLCHGEATVRPDGLFFSSKTYTCARAEREGWFVKAQSNRWKIPILFHPSNLSVVYLNKPGRTLKEVNDLLEPCFRTKVEGDFPEISRYEHELLQISRADRVHDSREHRVSYTDPDTWPR